MKLPTIIRKWRRSGYVVYRSGLATTRCSTTFPPMCGAAKPILIGPSGSGKTTLLRCINLLEDFQEGEILIGGDANGYTTDHSGKRVRRSEADIADEGEAGYGVPKLQSFPPHVGS